MAHPIIAGLRIFQGAHAPLAALIKTADGEIAEQADFSAIAYVVTHDTGEIGSGTLTISDVIDDTPTAVWRESKDAPNFTWDVPPDLTVATDGIDDLPPPQTFWAKVTFTMAGGFIDVQVWRIDVLATEDA